MKNGSAMPLAELRERLGLTQQEAADLIPVERGQLSKIENGHAVPTLRVVFGMARVYRVNVHKIIDLLASTLKKNGRLKEWRGAVRGAA